MARIVPHWKGIAREFRQYREGVKQKNYDLDLTFLMRAITVVECRVPGIKKLADTISNDPPTRHHLERVWRTARGAIDRMIRILQQRLSLDKSKFFTSKNALVPLVYCLAELKGKQRVERDVVRLFLLSQLSGHYSKAAETALRKDFRVLTDSAQSASQSASQGLVELVDVVKREAKWEYPGLRIKAQDVRGVSSKNVLVLLMYILMRRRNATDWGTGKRPTLDEIEPAETELHHIFPSDYLNKNDSLREWYLERGYSGAEFRDDINDIANLTFLSKSKNGEIGDDPPAQYFLTETTREMRKAHFIPEDPDLWKTENFRKFLDERRRLLGRAMSRFLRTL